MIKMKLQFNSNPQYSDVDLYLNGDYCGYVDEDILYSLVGDKVYNNIDNDILEFVISAKEFLQNFPMSLRKKIKWI